MDGKVKERSGGVHAAMCRRAAVRQPPPAGRARSCAPPTGALSRLLCRSYKALAPQVLVRFLVINVALQAERGHEGCGAAVWTRGERNVVGGRRRTAWLLHAASGGGSARPALRQQAAGSEAVMASGLSRLSRLSAAHLGVLKLLLLHAAAALPLLQALPQRHRVRDLGDLEELRGSEGKKAAKRQSRGGRSRGAAGGQLPQGTGASTAFETDATATRGAAAGFQQARQPGRHSSRTFLLLGMPSARMPFSWRHSRKWRSKARRPQ